MLAARFFLGAAALAVAALAGCAAARPAPVDAATTSTIRLVGVRILPHTLVVDNTPVGGLSGIDWLGGNEWVLISDDRSRNAPARFYRATLAIGDTGITELTIRSAHTIRRADGTPFPAPGDSRRSARDPDDIVVDPESIRAHRVPSTDLLIGGHDPRPGRPLFEDPAPTGSHGREPTLLWTSEGDRERGLPPEIRAMGLDGSFRRAYPMDSLFSVSNPDRGPRDNGTFEALAIGFDGQIVVALEQPLLQDGPAASPDVAGPVRISWIDEQFGRLRRQVAYLPELAPEPAKPGGGTDNGVVEILMYDHERLLVLERAWAEGIGNTVRLFLADTTGATNILRREISTQAPESAPQLHADVRVCRKQLLLDFATLGLPRLDNIEGMSWGPRTVTGRTLVFVSDNNFNPAQVTQIVVVEFGGW